jgi:hypothetical protein
MVTALRVVSSAAGDALRARRVLHYKVAVSGFFNRNSIKLENSFRFDGSGGYGKTGADRVLDG